MEIGFIGLGAMGGNMAARLQSAGHRLTIYDQRRSAGEAHEGCGAIWADTPAKVAEASELVFASLPGPPEIEATGLGPSGILQGLRPSGTYIDLSTNSPSMARKVNAAFAAKGCFTLDAPVSGGPAMAAAGTLTLWVSGDENAFNKYRSVMEIIGKKVSYVGASGAASVVKLVNNTIRFGMTAVTAEIFTLGVKAGVEPQALYEALRQGNIGQSRTFDGLIDQFLTGIFDPPSFALRLGHKDVSLTMALAREYGVPTRLASLTLEEMTEAMARGWADRDSRVFTLLQEERAGVNIEIDPKKLRAVRADDK